MTTQDYQIGVGLQACLVAVFSLFAAVMGLGSISEYKARTSYLEAVSQREYGTEASMRVLENSLTRSLKQKPDLPAALMLRGWLGIELNDATMVKESYEKLKEVLANKGLPQGVADDGLGCALIMEANATEDPETKKKLIDQAYQRFENATRDDWNNADPHVNAAICKLYSPDRSTLVKAAEHLVNAKKTKNFSYDSLVAYHAALGTLLVRAHVDRNIAQRVADQLADDDKDLAKPGRMLMRGADELEKAASVARTDSMKVKLKTHAALAETKIVNWAPMPRLALIDMCNNIIDQAEKHKSSFTPQQRQAMFSTVAYIHSKAGRRDSVSHYSRAAIAQKFTDPVALLQVAAAYINALKQASTPIQRSEYLKNGISFMQKMIAQKELNPSDIYLFERALAEMYYHNGEFKRSLELLESAASPEKITGLSAIEQASLYRNIAIGQLAVKNGQGALETVRKALSLDKDDSVSKKLLASLAGPIQILNIKAIPGEKLPPSLPIVLAKITGGVEPIDAEKVRFEIDGVMAEVKAGNAGMFYAIPSRPLSEGVHKIKITASAKGRATASAEAEFEVTFDEFLKAAR